jgi:predicted acyltransferase
VYLRIARRVVALVLLGLIANGMLKFEWDNLRYPGVLQRIGICYGIGAILYLKLDIKGLSIGMIAILLSYWALLRFVPTPGGDAGDLSIEGNLCGWVDRQLLPGKIMPQFYGYGDNEGILSTIPAVATVISGILAASLLRSGMGNSLKVFALAAAGFSSVALGLLWHGWFPVIKILWTSSFVLVSSGWSLVLLAAFYAIIDVIGLRRWSIPFVIIGVNAITIYIAQRFIDFSHMSRYFFSGAARISGYETTVLLAGVLLCKLLFLWFLYSKKVFLRV